MYTLIVIPVVMFLFGVFLKNNHSRYIGYRTYMSVKSEECWWEAQRIASKAFMTSSYLLIAFIFLYVFTGGSLIGHMVFQLLVWMGCMTYVEMELRKQFDNKGRRK